jgi:EAL domain-containing protein (putative c-di-GMP-specific phosphodiesterase class I)
MPNPEDRTEMIDATGSAASRSRHTAGAESDPKESTILVVEDDPAVAQTIVRILSTEWNTSSARNGREALEAFQAGDFDVLVTDLQMPGMGGLALLERVRQLSEDLPVILMTGNPSIETAIEAVELRAFKYLSKPFAANDLKAVVRDAVRHARMARIRREALEVASQPDPRNVDQHWAELEKARNSLWIAYQPIVDRALTVVGYEGLLRWRVGSFEGPVELLSIAQHLGLDEELGRQIRHLAPKPFATRPDLRLFLNVDAHQIGRPYLETRDDALAGMADRTVLELTEHNSLKGIGGLESTVLELKSIGYGLAVDDLGAGYSGLSSFAQIGPNYVKLDRNLVSGVARQPDRQRVINGINRLCHELDIRVIAEGVEERQDLEMLLDLGCDFLQGYLIGRPQPLP